MAAQTAPALGTDVGAVARACEGPALQESYETADATYHSNGTGAVPSKQEN